MKKNQNIILIGMAGAGKSTLGVLLAKALGMDFIDSDIIIQQRENRLLQEIIDADGIDAFLKTEEEIVSSLGYQNTIIATGGSVIYGQEAMAHLRSIGTVVYLQLSYEQVKERLGDLHARGVTVKPGQTLRDLYNERCPLYASYAHVTIPCDGLRLREVVAQLRQTLGLDA